MRTVLLLFVILVSCNSNRIEKNRIVEQMKSIRVQIESKENNINRPILDTLAVLLPDGTLQHRLIYDTTSLRREIDSLDEVYKLLEIELKKY